MGKPITSKALLQRHVKRKDRILLVNPPVEETRYSWVRWNQPLDLLQLGSHLVEAIGCSVELFDCMKPNKKGEVKNAWLPSSRRYYNLRDERYPMRLYGEPCSSLSEYIRQKKSTPNAALPTQVWITSLCSYWYKTVAELCREVQLSLPDSQVVLIGQYPRFMPDHAKDWCAADYIVTDSIPLNEQPWTLDLYGNEKPPFIAVQLDHKHAISAVKSAVTNGIYDVTFFEEDICKENGEVLADFVNQTRDLHKHLRYHIICGLEPARVTPTVAKLLANKQFVAIHFEEAGDSASLDIEVYQRVRSYLKEANSSEIDDRLSGFVWIGRPGDKLEAIILRTFQVLQQMGSLILKPFTPTPGSSEHRQNESLLSQLPHNEWSPHFFPFAELNGITRSEYHDLYRMAAFLNEKVRDRSFDFLDGTLGAQMLRESLRREVWKLEPSPFRIVD